MKVREISGTLSTLLNYIVTDIEKRPRSFKIGVFSIFLVVTFLVVLQSALHLTPGVFLKLAQDRAGQYDLTIIPVAAENDTRVASSDSSTDSSTSSFIVRGLNFTDIEAQLETFPEIAGMSPRWLLPVKISNPNTPDESYNILAIVLDSLKEREIGIGTNIDLKDLGMGECWISASTGRLTQVKEGQVHMTIDFLNTLADLGAVSITNDDTEDSSSSNSAARAIAIQLVHEQLIAQGGIQVGTSEMYSFGTGTLATIKIGRQASPWDTASGVLTRKREELSHRVLTETSSYMPFESTPPYKSSAPTDSIILPEGPVSYADSAPSASADPFGIGDILNNANFPINITGIDLSDPLTFTQDDVTILVNSSRFVDAILPVIIEGFTLEYNFTVTEIVDSTKGKWPGELGNVIVIDSKYLVKIFEDNLIVAIDNINTTVNTGNSTLDAMIPEFINKTEMKIQVQEAAQQFNINEYALMVNILLSGRRELYADKNNIKPNLIKITNKIYKQLGRTHPSTVSSALDAALELFFLFKNFLDNIFNATVFILILLSALLIYSLMNSNVEEKTYEFGMLRALGMEKANLTTLLILQSGFFAIPGLILGLILSFTINFMVTYYISDFVTVKNSYWPAASAIILGVCMAFIVPFFSNLIPIRKALAKTLRDSLSVYHRTISDVTIRVMKLAEMGVSPAQTIGSLTMIVMGFITYYVAPYSFIYENISLFFIILTVILVMMVIGFTLIMNLLQPILEKAILKLMLLVVPRERLLQPVILKNFDSHRGRNNKTSLMLSIALAFLIFAGTGFRLNASVIAQQMESSYGSDLMIKALYGNYLDEAYLRENLEQFRTKFPGVIKDYAFISQPFRDQPEISEVRFECLSRTPRRKTEIISVDESFLTSTYDEYFLPEEADPRVSWTYIPGTSKVDAAKALYSSDGLETSLTFDKYDIMTNAGPRSNNNFDGNLLDQEIRVIISKGLSSDSSVHVDTSGIVEMSPLYNKARVRAVATKIPGFFFSGYKSYADYTIITSHEDYKKMRDKLWEITSTETTRRSDYLKSIPDGSTYDVIKQGIMIKYNGEISEEMRLNLVNTMGALINNRYVIVQDVVDTITSLKGTLVFIDVFFIIVAIIAVSLSFFFIIISFVSNISENSWEFGVLRAIGLSKKHMMKIYVLEALCLVIAAAILGTIVGIAVAMTSSALFFLFTELPFTLEFPTAIFLVTLISSLITAVYGSKTAVDDIKDKQISSIIKSLE